MSNRKTYALASLDGYGDGCERVNNRLVRGYALTNVEFYDAAYPYEMPKQVYFSEAQRKLYMVVTDGISVMEFPHGAAPSGGDIWSMRYRPLLAGAYYRNKTQACFADDRRMRFLDGKTSLSAAQSCPFVPTTMCVHHGRAFITDGEYKLAWSGLNGVDMWGVDIDYSGSVTLPYQELGKVLRLFSFGDDVLVLRTGGITFFTAFGSPENFKFRAQSITLQNVDPASVAYAEPCLYFKTQNGFWCYDGALKRLDMGIYALQTVKSATARQGEYFVSGTANDQNCVVCYRQETEKAHRVADFAPMLFGSTDVYAVDGNGVYQVERAQTVAWSTYDDAFGSANRKRVTAVLFPTGYTGTFTVYADGVRRAISVCQGRQYVAMNGQTFAFEAEGELSLGEILVEVETENGH